jgi:hypothetical protein
MIKQGAREERRQSIHKLEIEKNLVFHPKKDRSKSIPTINMNLRLQALKDMKEDLLMRKCKVLDEIADNEYELRVQINEFNYNDIKRRILPKPIMVQIQYPELKKRKQYLESNDAEEEKDAVNMSNNFRSDSNPIPMSIMPPPNRPAYKMMFTYKYKTPYDDLVIEEENKFPEVEKPLISVPESNM